MRGLPALLLLILVAASSVSVHAAGEWRSLTVDVPVAVILYGVHGQFPRWMLVEQAVLLGNWSVLFKFNVSFVEAPGWAVSALRDWLNNNYVDRPAPPWVSTYLRSHGIRVGVRWLNLTRYYVFLYNLSLRVLREANISPVDVVAVVGNVDNVSRVLYASKPYPWVRGYVENYTGVRGYAGWEMFTFYDLSTVPKRWPSYPMPFYHEGRPVTPETEPPIWSLNDTVGYVEGLVRSHLLYHLANYLPSAKPWYRPWMRVEVYVVGYSNETTREILASLDTGELLRLLRLLDPWVGFNVTLKILGAGEAPWGRLNTTSLGNATVVDLEENPVLRNTSLWCRAPWGVLRFYWLALPGGGFMTIGWRLNFTGISLGGCEVAAYPGYHGRVPRQGAAKVVAHEAGHSMGLWHPFQRLGPRGYPVERWLMDEAYTVMSYMDGFDAPAPQWAPMSYEAWKLALLHSLALLDKAPQEARAEALSLLEKGRPVKALRVLLDTTLKAGGEAPTPVEATAPAASKTATVTVSVTKTLTETAARTITTTAMKTVTETVTSTTVATRTVTRTVNAGTGGGGELLLLLLLLLLLVLLLPHYSKEPPGLEQLS